MGVRAPLTKIASLCLSIEVSLLPLQNPFAFQQHEVISPLYSSIVVKKLHGDFRTILNEGESLFTV